MSQIWLCVQKDSSFFLKKIVMFLAIAKDPIV